MVTARLGVVAIDGALLLKQQRTPMQFRHGGAHLAPGRGVGGSVVSGESNGVRNGGWGGLLL